MLMKWVRSIVMALIAVTAVYGSSSYATANTTLVVPARYTVIQLAFDIAALRDATLISYEKSDAGKDPVLYVWNTASSAWKNISIDEYSIGSFSREIQNSMILIGSDSDLPASIIEGASQAKKVTRINTLNTADIVNILDNSMKFTQSEWRALAGKHGFKIQDYNAERRRWGRYGPPGEKKQTKKKIKKIEVAPEKFEYDCVDTVKKESENPFKVLENELKMPEPKTPMHLEISADDKPLEENAATIKSKEIDVPLVIKPQPKTEDDFEFPEDK